MVVSAVTLEGNPPPSPCIDRGDSLHMFGDMVYTDNRHDFKPAEVVMPWREVSMMSERKEFVTLALSADRANVREMCRRFGISAPTGYKWLRRYGQEGNAGLTDLSRRPRRSPGRTPAEVERVVLEVRDRHPAWGARKLRVWLLTHGYARMPSPRSHPKMINMRPLKASQSLSPGCHAMAETPSRSCNHGRRLGGCPMGTYQPSTSTT